MRIGHAGGRLGGIRAALAMRLIKPFGLVIIGLVVAVFQRPRGGNAVLMPHFLKVPFPQAKERRAINLRIAADPVGGLGMKGFAFAVLPDLVRVVTVSEKDGLGVPILLFLRQKSAAFEDENALAAGGEALGERAAAGARPDDDDVVIVHGVSRRPDTGKHTACTRAQAGACRGAIPDTKRFPAFPRQPSFQQKAPLPAGPTGHFKGGESTDHIIRAPS